MSAQHAELAAGRWRTLSLVEQMAHIGSEVERALNWRAKKNLSLSQRAFERALELIDLSLAATARFAQLKEFARLREALVDEFIGVRQMTPDESAWRRYFGYFTWAARRTRA